MCFWRLRRWRDDAGRRANHVMIGGSKSGLAANGLVLTFGTSTVPPPVFATSSMMPTPAGANTAYSVSVATQPDGQTCAVTAGGCGTVRSPDVKSVTVSCETVAGLWTWVGGARSVGAPGAYGEQGVANANNWTGARHGAVTFVDNRGRFWLFGDNGSGP